LPGPVKPCTAEIIVAQPRTAVATVAVFRRAPVSACRRRADEPRRPGRRQPAPRQHPR
jgi:hypothetical protein